MNQVEKALIHALFVHLHHNIDKAIDFGALKALNERMNEKWPGALLVGPDADDDAAVCRLPGCEGLIAAKMESHCSPCVPRPYDAAATGAGGAMRDVVAMGARPVFLLDFIGTRPLEEEVIVGPCGFSGSCSCGNCKVMTSKERLDLMIRGITDMAEALEVFVVGGGFSTSFSDIVPAVVVAVIGSMVTGAPLTKPAKAAGDMIIIIGKTGRDGNDTLYRAGLAGRMRPAAALFDEERAAMETALLAFGTERIKACSDLGAAGVGAAVCESARYGGLGARVELASVPAKEEITPEEALICETQARYIIQVAPQHVDEVLAAAGGAVVIGEITDGDSEVFEYNGRKVAEIPNSPSGEMLANL